MTTARSRIGAVVTSFDAATTRCGHTCRTESSSRPGRANRLPTQDGTTFYDYQTTRRPLYQQPQQIALSTCHRRGRECGPCTPRACTRTPNPTRVDDTLLSISHSRFPEVAC